MWKVVAADDEGYIREALKKLINWEKMDCDLIAVLEDGQELIECIEKESHGGFHKMYVVEIVNVLSR